MLLNKFILAHQKINYNKARLSEPQEKEGSLNLLNIDDPISYYKIYLYPYIPQDPPVHLQFLKVDCI